jgi:nucleoside-triphosphatase
MTKSVYLLTGLPGVGKTSLIKQAVAALGDKAGGFYTEEIRVNGVRQGFRIITLDGHTSLFAHIDIRSLHRVSKYGVDTDMLDDIGVTALQKAAQRCDLVVIDEIGKMELFSEKFKSIVLEIIESGKKILGTIMLKSDPWADKIKQEPQVQIITLTRDNRPEILVQIQEWLGEIQIPNKKDDGSTT